MICALFDLAARSAEAILSATLFSRLSRATEIGPQANFVKMAIKIMKTTNE